MPFPEIPDRFISHFIRGCWDGDGTVFVPKTGDRNQAYASIVSGSPDFMAGLVHRLHDVGIKRRGGTHLSEPLSITWDHNSRDVRVKGIENLTTLFQYLYDGVDSSMMLERKYLNFLAIMKLYGY